MAGRGVLNTSGGAPGSAFGGNSRDETLPISQAVSVEASILAPKFSLNSIATSAVPALSVPPFKTASTESHFERNRNVTILGRARIVLDLGARRIIYDALTSIDEQLDMHESTADEDYNMLNRLLIFWLHVSPLNDLASTTSSEKLIKAGDLAVVLIVLAAIS